MPPKLLNEEEKAIAWLRGSAAFPRARTPEHGEESIWVMVMKWMTTQEGTPGSQGLTQWEMGQGWPQMRTQFLFVFEVSGFAYFKSGIWGTWRDELGIRVLVVQA